MTIPTEPDEQLRWLVDRACISDLLVAYARCVDGKEFDELAALFSETGELALPFVSLPASEIAAGSAEALSPYWATHHMSSNHAIDIVGDRARSRSYFQAVHVPSIESIGAHGDIGGWYDNTYVRESDNRWKFNVVGVTFRWTLGGGFPGEGQPLRR